MKILWAVDVFESHPKAISAMSIFLKAFSLMRPIEVDAVSVVYPSEGRPSDLTRKEAISLLQARLGQAKKQKWFRREHVILESQIPQRVAVMDLVQFAQNGQYDAIAVVKHSRLGVKRAFLGSFAEMLAFLSPVPLILVNPDGALPKKIRRILFATDADQDCGSTFKKLSQFIFLTGTSVRLHHRIPFVFPSRMTTEDQRFYKKVEAKRALENFVPVQEIALALGATTEAHVVQENVMIEESILKEARRDQSDLIVLIHKGKGAIGFFLGKVTRRVLQNADRPVLLFRI